MTPWESICKNNVLFKLHPKAKKVAVIDGNDTAYLWFVDGRRVLSDVDWPKGKEYLSAVELKKNGYKILSAQKGWGKQLYESVYGGRDERRTKRSR